VASQILWSNSFLLMIIIVAFAQLPTQLLAQEKMLGFFNLPFFPYHTIVMPTLFVESLGLTHSAYILKDFLVWAFKIDQSKADPNKTMKNREFYYVKCLWSVVVVTFCGVFLFKGWFMGQTGATSGVGWENLPAWAAIIVSVFFLFVMACAEGIQVSALALESKVTADFKDKPRVHDTLMLLGGSDGVKYKGRNMQAFLVGRQMFVAMMVVLLGRVTTYAGSQGVLVNGSDWGMGKNFNEWFLQTGFCGAIFVCNVAQLATQILASIFPVSLINNFFMYFLLQVLLLTEAIGLPNACWPLMWFLDWAFQKMGLLHAKEPELKKTYDPYAKVAGTGISDPEEAKKPLADFGQDIENGTGAAGAVAAFVGYEGLLDSGITKTHGLNYGSTPNEGCYPNPEKLAKKFEQNGAGIPRFLLPPSHPDHVPPHIVAFWLMSMSQEKNDKGEKARV